ncbi:uncharacterized protein LOC119581121 isoform X1 [Penaeus monodon]|uniref:uncharacterized protein LOC119581121 isoform X1 n=1 Tax=Penaeus monodon TaxID=6687 RepID=UPI0018A75C4B|nr:uncharacterized protein LOC119581121 isoform X1 [Penaeus monodon]
MAQRPFHVGPAAVTNTIPALHLDLESYASPAYPTPFVHIVRWSKLWGCLPVSYARNSRSWTLSPLLVFWVVCNIGFNIPTFYDCIKSSLGSDGLMLYVMIMIVCVMSVSGVSMHVLSLVHYSEWVKFLNDWMLFERKFPTLTVGVHSRRVALPLFVGFLLYIAFFVVNIFNELRFNLINEDGVGRMLSLVYVYVIYSYTLSMPVLWVVMASKVFALCLTHIRHELESILECVKFGMRCTTSPIQKCIATGDINRLQEAVLDLAKIIESFKVIMGPFMLVVVPHHIISLICFLYWTLVSVLDYSDWYYPLSFGLLSAQAIAPIFCAAIYSEDIHTQKDSLVEPLIILKSSMPDEAAKHKMATLIDHLDRLDAQIEGRGFFTLNKGMATSVRLKEDGEIIQVLCSKVDVNCVVKFLYVTFD